MTEVPPHDPADEAPATDETAAPEPRNRRRLWRRIGIGVLVLILMVSLLGAYVYRRLDGNLTKANYSDTFVEPRPTEVVPADDGKPIDILVMGSDSRKGKNNIDGLVGLGDRSDTTILLHLSGDRSRAYGVSIPRDALITRPDCRDPDTGEILPGDTDVEWNEAFGVGGPGCTQSQFEQISDIRVDYTVVIDFNGFKEMVDAVDGVSVCIPETIHDDKTGITLEAGEREISGDEALDYVRIRSGENAAGEDAITGSDLGRIKRQQTFLAAMSNKIISAETLTNPLTLFDFLEATTKSLEIGGADSLMDLAQLGYQFRDIGAGKIQFVTIPWQYAPEDPNRVRLLPESAQVWDRLRSDKELTPAQLSDSVSAKSSPGGKGGGRGGAGSNGGGDEDGLCT